MLNDEHLDHDIDHLLDKDSSDNNDDSVFEDEKKLAARDDVQGTSFGAPDSTARALSVGRI